MDRQSDSQLELFSESTSDNASRVNSDFGNGFFRRIRGYEKIILAIFVILVISIISFSLGVETSKITLASVKNSTEQVVKVEKAVIPLPPPEVPQVIVKNENVLKQTPAIASQGSFTIQVASFKTKGNAVKEAEVFKKKGLSTQFIKKGKYVILCVGNFPNKETAQPLLSELSKRYRSCYIRRL